jgi:hypothetical protein
MPRTDPEDCTMADEFKTLTEGFTTLGSNYCANAKKVVTDIEARKVIEIYEAGLAGAMTGLNEMLNKQYQSLSDDGKVAVDEFTRQSGVLPMLEAANRVIGPDSLASIAAVGAAAELFPKIKSILRGLLDIEEGGWTDKILDWIDTIIENIPKLLGAVRG